MVADKFPMLVIEELLEEQYESKNFSKIDLSLGTTKFGLPQKTSWRQRFELTMGTTSFRVMLFGLTNALATFKSLVNNIFSDYLYHFVLVIFYDILVYSVLLG